MEVKNVYEVFKIQLWPKAFDVPNAIVSGKYVLNVSLYLGSKILQKKIHQLL